MLHDHFFRLLKLILESVNERFLRRKRSEEGITIIL